MSASSRTVQNGGGASDGEKPEATTTPAKPPESPASGSQPAIVVSRVVNVSAPYAHVAPTRALPPPVPTAAARAAKATPPRVPTKTQPMAMPVLKPAAAAPKPTAPAPVPKAVPPAPNTVPALPLTFDDEEDIEQEPKTEPRVGPLPMSTRPTAPDQISITGDGEASIAETFEKLLGDVDARFAAILEPDTDGGPASVHEGRAVNASDLEGVRELFAQLAAKHMRQVRDFMLDLKWGEAPHSWIAVCEPAVRSLHGAAERLEMEELSAGLDLFGEALGTATAASMPMIDGELRERLIAIYEELIAVMPGAFSLEMDRNQRESVIVHSLLLQIPGVRKVTIERLYAAGLSSLDTMFAAKPDDVADTTGIARDLSERIVAHFQQYRSQLKTTVPDATRTHERERIGALAKQLRAQHDAFEKASDGWSGGDLASKKELRQARAATLLEVNLLLARLGEVERLRAIERLPFDRKVSEIESYLEDAERVYMPTS